MDASSWVAMARRLAADGALPEAVAAYERAVRSFDRPGRDAGGSTGPAVRVRLFGAFELRIDGVPVGSAGLRPQHHALLQALCVHAGRAVPDTRLGEWFWPDAEPGRVRHRVAVGVSALRSMLTAAGGPSLIRDRDGYRLVLAHDGTDVRRFDQLAADARGGRREGRTERLEAAFAAYGGTLLPGAGEAAWVVEERDRVRARASWVAAELADAFARAGRPRDVVRVTRTALRWDRCQDRLWRRLVAALTDLAEPAAAAAARREYTAMLDDLGVVAWPAAGRRLHSA
ncbi:AfsR/SARP family transcriptional regulator [Nakamurella deserti]|uniref:AfsR/SARP family transcriptional regulator n=1 Tax=Nakamurella deserti TaxID=2164074 RepID=UPI0013008E60|nr:BTAD domain-containing putative transcriptional regulator [Nakamurella deserti]